MTIPRLRAAAILLLMALASPWPAAAGEVAKNENTNVILISLQCLRPDHLGAYGYKRETSKNIDALAKGSVLFENAIAQANLTPVAQMSVFTSQYPRVNGMVSFEVAKDKVSQTTLPSVLKAYGYTTAATLSAPEFFMRYDAEMATMVNPGDLFSRSFDYYGRTIKGPGGGSIRKVPTDALKWIRDNQEKKFFLWIGSGLLHMPYSAAVPLAQRTMYDPPKYTPFWKRLTIPEWKGKGEVNGDPSYDIFSRVFHNKFYWGGAEAYKLTEADVQYVNARYDAGVYHTDLFIGELLKLLDSLHLTEKTLVILHSIHGEELGEQGNFFHYDVTDTVIKNALMIRFPKGEFGGKRVVEQVQGIDIMPTVLNYLEIPVPHEAQGSSLLPLLSGKNATPPNEYAYIDRMPWWEYTLSKWYLEFQSSTGAHFAPSEKVKEYLAMLRASFDSLTYPPGDIAIRSNQWKLIVRKHHALLNKVSWWSYITGQARDVPEMELYDLVKDPGEKANVVAQHPAEVALLKEKLLKWDATVESQRGEYNKDSSQRLIIPYP